MTPEKLRDIDHKVLGAIGIEVEYWSELKDPVAEDLRGPMVEREDETYFECHPSTDLNAAMFAAQKAGMFKEYGWHLSFNGAQWEVWQEVDESGEKLWGLGPDGPIALSKAILLFKGDA